MKKNNNLLELIKELRKKTQAPMMDCKEALQEAKTKKNLAKDAILQEAIKILKSKGKKIMEQKKEAKTEEGLITGYIHHGGKIGVLVELNCQTDFVARTEDFQSLCKDIAMQIAAMAPKYISREDIPVELKEEKLKEYTDEARRENKPEHIVDKIVANKMNDFYKEVCLLDQLFIKDEKITVSEYIASFISKLKENIKIRRFVRFELGE